MTMFEKNDPQGTPAPPPPIPPLGHDQGDRMKIHSDLFCMFHLTTHIKFGIKVFEIDMLTERTSSDKAGIFPS